MRFLRRFAKVEREYANTTCPYCAAGLDPPPRAKKRCPSCGQPIYVQSGPDGLTYLLQEVDLPVFEAAWAEHREADARAEGARVFAAARAEREAEWARYNESQDRAKAAIDRTTAGRRRRHAAAMAAAGVTHVKVLISADACPACRAAARYRHRLDTAPSLPIEGCTSAICRCGYLPVPAPHPRRKPA